MNSGAATWLLDADGVLSTHDLAEAPQYSKPVAPIRSRVAYASAHVIPRAWAENVPGSPADLDWDATLAYRHHLWSWGLGVADAMDTAQRNMGLDAAATQELVRRSAAEAASAEGKFVVGVNTDHVEDVLLGLDQVIDAYVSQLEYAEEQGAGAALMASRHLARAAESAKDYRYVYSNVLARATRPVILHWLGPAFDSALAGYWGAADWQTASDTVVTIMTDNADKVSGIKMSLLDASSEIAVRRRLPPVRGHVHRR